MKKTLLPLTLILVVGFIFRITGLNWDQDQHLNPDERFLTMVTQNLRLPLSLNEYLDTPHSTFNPNNIGYDFYVYGTLPIHMVKIVALRLNLNDYTYITLLGRFVSAVLDTISILLIYLISRRLRFSNTSSLLSSFTYAIMALPIQLSHFFTVDPYVVFFSLLSVYFVLFSESKQFLVMLAGIATGLAISSKISAILLIIPVGVIFLFQFFVKGRKIRVFISGLIYLLFLLFTVRLFFPYLFATNSFFSPTLNPQFLANIKQLQSFNTYDGWFPPSVQWISIRKGLFPFENILLWGLGLPLGVLGLISLIVGFVSIKKYSPLTVPLVTIISIFLYQSFQFAQPMRYFYPLYPFLALTIGFTLSQINSKIILATIMIVSILWPLSYTSVYIHPHTRVAATSWINSHIPANSKISCEVWDDCLPLGGPGQYNIVELPLYNSESTDKWPEIESRLNNLDYIILSSNRLYGSIMANPQIYPQTAQWYQKLFDGQLGFKKIAEFTSRPHLPFTRQSICLTPPFVQYGKVALSSQLCSTPGISFVDDYADESWTVYDHPKVIIFQKVSLLPQPN